MADLLATLRRTAGTLVLVLGMAVQSPQAFALTPHDASAIVSRMSAVAVATFVPTQPRELLTRRGRLEAYAPAATLTAGSRRSIPPRLPQVPG